MMKKITHIALAVSCSLAVSSCSNDDWANRICDLHGYPKVSPAAEVVVPPAPVPPPAPPALEKSLYEREVISPLPPPAPKKHKKKRKVDVREAS